MTRSPLDSDPLKVTILPAQPLARSIGYDRL